MTNSRRRLLLLVTMILLAVCLYLADLGTGLIAPPSARKIKKSVPQNSSLHSSEYSQRKQEPYHEGSRVTGNEEKQAISHPIRSASFAFSSAVTATPRGILTTRTIEELELTDEEVRQVTVAIHNMMDQAASDFVSRTRLTDSRKNGSDSSYTYFTPARPDRGQAFLETFREEMEGILDDERSRKLSAGMDSFSYAGGMGRCDLETEIVRGGGGAVVRQHYLDPKNGRVFYTSESSPSAFQESFGDLFDVTGEKP